MRRIAFFLALIGSLQPLYPMVRAGVEVDHDDGYYDYNDDWDGPGFYYGIYFDNDADYYDWRRGGYYYDRGYYHGHGGHDHGRGHHSGGHGRHH